MNAQANHIEYKRNAETARRVPDALIALGYAHRDHLGCILFTQENGYAEQCQMMSTVAERYRRFVSGDVGLFERIALADQLSRDLLTLWNALAQADVWRWRTNDDDGAVYA